MGKIASYSNQRIDADELDETNFIGVDNLLQNAEGKINSKYPPNISRLTAYQKGDILIGNIRPYLKKIWLANNDGGCSGDVLAIHIKGSFQGRITSKFLYYILSSDKFFAYDMQHAKGAKMPRGSKEKILKYPIPLPPLPEQEKIVKILDRFDALINDISEGLPAEIKARRQQYEYYRDRLLTFRECQ